jgi:hypothetical protein
VIEKMCYVVNTEFGNSPLPLAKNVQQMLLRCSVDESATSPFAARLFHGFFADDRDFDSPTDFNLREARTFGEMRSIALYFLLRNEHTHEASYDHAGFHTAVEILIRHESLPPLDESVNMEVIPGAAIAKVLFNLKSCFWGSNLIETLRIEFLEVCSEIPSLVEFFSDSALRSYSDPNSSHSFLIQCQLGQVRFAAFCNSLRPKARYGTPLYREISSVLDLKYGHHWAI